MTVEMNTHRRECWLLLGVVVAGFLVRAIGIWWGQGTGSSFIGDEIDEYKVALNLAAGDERAWYIGAPAFGSASVSGNKPARVPGPFWALFWLAGLRLGNGPEGVLWLVVVMNTCGIVVVYSLARQMLASPAGLRVALFYATAPWPVHYSVGAWNPSLMPFLGGLLCWASWRVVNTDRTPLVFLLPVGIGIMLQCHTITTFLIPAVLLVLGLNVSRLNRKWLLIGVVVTVVLYVPYIVGESHHDWENTRAMFATKGPSLGSIKAAALPVINLASLAFDRADHLLRYRELSSRLFGAYWVPLIVGVISLGFALVVVWDALVDVWRVFRDARFNARRAFATAPAAAFCGIFLFLPVLLMIGSLVNYNNRYSTPFLPLVAVLPEMFNRRCAPGSPRQTRFRVVLTALILFNVAVDIGGPWMRGRLIADANFLTLTFRKMEAVRQRLRADAGPDARITISTSLSAGDDNAGFNHDVGLLSDYIAAREDSERTESTQIHPKRFTARAAGEPVPADQRMVYQSNSLVVTAAR